MKQLILLVLGFVPCFLFGQSLDSLTVKEVDSLIQQIDKYSQSNDFEMAEKTYLEVIDIFENQLHDTEHEQYLKNLINLGRMYLQTGNYDKAELFLLKAKHIFEEVLNDDKHPIYINCLMSLSIYYYNIGSFDKYESHGLETIKIVGNAMGKDNPTYAGALINLSNFYNGMKRYEKVEPLLLEAKVIFEASLEMKKHPFYLNCLSNLGLLYFSTDDMEKAEDFFLQSLELRKKIQGPDHLAYGSSLFNLADVYKRQKKYEKAEFYYFQATGILEKLYGKEHPYYVSCQFNYSDLCMEKKDILKAEALMTELNRVNQSILKRSIYHMSEEEMGAYLKTSPDYKTIIFHAAQVTQEMESTFPQTCYDYTLFHKGFLLNAKNQINRVAITDSENVQNLDSLKIYKQKLATEYAKPPMHRDSTLLIDWEEKSYSFEKQIARTTAGFGEIMRQVNWSEVKSKLKEGEAAIEFVHYFFQNDDQNEIKRDSNMYAGILLLPKNKPLFVSLFEEKQLKKILQKIDQGNAIGINNFYKKEQLYDLIWLPLEIELAGIKTIYYSPSGLLHRLNLNAININEKTTLGDQYKLVQLNSTRQLVIPSTIENETNNALLFGGIQYEMDTTKIAAVNYDLNKIATRGSLNFNQSDSTHRGGTWDYLDWTEIEVAAIESILKESNIETTLRGGYKATEEAFKSIASPSPRILHIATHGFFFPDPESERRERIESVREEPVFKMSDHPMIRSGLIMAGGNHAWETGKPFKPDMEDGILTAYEISQMDLSNTELVVLSACETGLGDIEGNEGVYGLQRAFKIAGAKYLIMSLWQVPDYQTQQLMKVFYKKWLTDKMEIPDAFRAAQQAMKEQYGDPFLWAGFVLVE